jgi:phage/plasmid primase-like uncharacterized protein
MKTRKEKSPAANGAGKYTHPKPTSPFYLAQAVISSFKRALDQAGLTTKDKIVLDGKLRRFHVEGDKPGTMNGWYILYDDGAPAGAFGCWKRGISKTWGTNPDRELTQAQRKRNRFRMIEAQKSAKPRKPNGARQQGIRRCLSGNLRP